MELNTQYIEIWGELLSTRNIKRLSVDPFDAILIYDIQITRLMCDDVRVNCLLHNQDLKLNDQAHVRMSLMPIQDGVLPNLAIHLWMKQSTRAILSRYLTFEMLLLNILQLNLKTRDFINSGSTGGWKREKN